MNSGTCGDNLTWALTNSVLTIAGTGKMWDYYSNPASAWTFGIGKMTYRPASDAPWGRAVKKVIIQDGVTAIGAWAFTNCGQLSEVELPSTLQRIGMYAFAGCTGLKSITLPASVFIDDGAFAGCSNLRNVNNLSTADMDDGAFVGCKGLADSKGFLIIKDRLFGYFGTEKHVRIPNGVTRIEPLAFENGTLTGVTIPHSVESIGEGAFKNSGLISIDIPDSVIDLDDGAFENCVHLTGVRLPYTLDFRLNPTGEFNPSGEYLFKGCRSLTEVSIPKCWNVINVSMFEGCTGLTRVSILCEGSVEVEDKAFKGCTRLTEVYMPKNFYVSESVFDGCTSLTDIYYRGTKTDWEENVFMEDDNEPLANAAVHYNSKGPDAAQPAENRTAEQTKVPAAEKRSAASSHCPSCGEEIDPKFRLCPYCGTKLVCPSCGEKVLPRFKCCPYCGTKLS